MVKFFELAIQCAAPIRADRPDRKSVGEQLWTIRADYLRSVKKEFSHRQKFAFRLGPFVDIFFSLLEHAYMWMSNIPFLKLVFAKQRHALRNIKVNTFAVFEC